MRAKTRSRDSSSGRSVALAVTQQESIDARDYLASISAASAAVTEPTTTCASTPPPAPTHMHYIHTRTHSHTSHPDRSIGSDSSDNNINNINNIRNFEHDENDDQSLPIDLTQPTVLHWTSAESRLTEYAAIDRANSGFRGLVKQLLPRSWVKHGHRKFFDGNNDADSVRRHRIIDRRQRGPDRPGKSNNHKR